MCIPRESWHILCIHNMFIFIIDHTMYETFLSYDVNVYFICNLYKIWKIADKNIKIQLIPSEIYPQK